MHILNLFNGWADFLFFFCLLNASLAIFELSFFSKFTNQLLKWHQAIGYIFLVYAIALLEITFRLSFPMATILESGTLLLYGGIIFKCSLPTSALTTILTISIMQVVNGVFQSFSAIVSMVFANTLISAIIISVLTLAALFFSYYFVLKWFKGNNLLITRYAIILLIPIFFVLLVMQIVFMTYAYPVTNLTSSMGISSVVHNWLMLVIQSTAYFCLFTVLFAYKKLSESFEVKMRNALLEQQVLAQATSVQEIQMRYEQTRTFRHDIKGHWTVLEGFLKAGENSKALEYLDKLSLISDSLSFPCQTGNAVLDMLLTSKLGVAQQKGMKVDCCVKVPQNITIDDMDLCVVFSNALDNAIHASCPNCEKICQYLTLSACQRGDFFLIKIENSCSENNPPTKGSGIGLESIKAIAEKYNGTILIEQTPQMFRLNILFIIPLQPNCI